MLLYLPPGLLKCTSERVAMSSKLISVVAEIWQLVSKAPIIVFLKILVVFIFLSPGSDRGHVIVVSLRLRER